MPWVKSVTKLCVFIISQLKQATILSNYLWLNGQAYTYIMVEKYARILDTL